VTFTNNRRSMATWRRYADGSLELRAHWMFMSAPDDVVAALAGLLRKDALSRASLGEFIRENDHLVRAKTPRQGSAKRVVLRAVGCAVDLRDIHQHVNEAYFGGRSTAYVTWGRALRRRNPRRMNFGSYDSKRNVVTISRRLNEPDIHRYMVEFIMYHEILHESLGVGKTASGRRRIHGKEFRRLERQFPYYDKAVKYERERWGIVHRGLAAEPDRH